MNKLLLRLVPNTHILRERNMQWYLGTQLFSLTGLMLRSSLISLLLIDLVGKENAPPLIGMVWALNVLPGALFGVFVGLYLDRTDKRKVLVITALLGMVQAGILAYFAYTDVHHIAVWKIMAVMFFTGLTNAVDGVARNSLIKDAVVNKANIGIASILFTSLYTLGMVLGNGLVGYLVVTIGYGNSFVLNGLSFLILICGLKKMNFSHNTKKTLHAWTGIWKEVKGGARYTFSAPGVRFCIFLSAAITVFGFAYQVILTVIAKTMFHGGPKEYSYLAGIGGLGSLTGSIITVIWSKPRRNDFVVGGCLFAGISQILLGKTTDINNAALILFCCGFGFMTTFLPLRANIMELVDQSRMSVVLGITFMFFYGGMMVSSFASGYISKHAGCPVVLYGCGSVLIALPFLSGLKKIR